MDERINLEGVDGAVEGVSSQNRVKLDFENIESTESGFAAENRFGEAQEINPVQPQPVQAEAPVAPPMNAQVNEMQFNFAPPPIEEPTESKKAKKEKKAKVPKGKKDKETVHKILRIAIIVIVSIATLWTVMYTVDHVLACQGITPFFALSETEFEDGSLSYTCLGYKVQFMFDANDNLTQKCVPIWEDGPNDVRYARGELFVVE